MSLVFTLKLEEEDLQYFRSIMAKTQKKVGAEINESEVIAKTQETLTDTKRTKTPSFVKERLQKLQSLLNMLGDGEWELTQGERTNVLSALAYFVEPADLIHDEIPMLGFIDDAIMIELVIRELQHEIEAYEDFCNYRDGVRKMKGERSTHDSISDWTESKRTQLLARMHRRRTRMYQRQYRSKRRGPRISLF